jgi:CheY-like chemotaxis protein
MKRIFVAEDNTAIRELILELVSSFGYEGVGHPDAQRGWPHNDSPD